MNRQIEFYTDAFRRHLAGDPLVPSNPAEFGTADVRVTPFNLPDYPDLSDEISLLRPRTPTFSTRIITSLSMTEMVEDWSQVRSPSRARRRRKQGHRQNIRVVNRPDPNVLVTEEGMVMHPETERRLKQALVDRQDKAALDALYGRILG